MILLKQSPALKVTIKNFKNMTPQEVESFLNKPDFSDALLSSQEKSAIYASFMTKLNGDQKKDPVYQWWY